MTVARFLALGLLIVAIVGCDTSEQAPEVVRGGVPTADRLAPKRAPKSDTSTPPRGFTGVFSTMDERQRCKASKGAVVCASTGSGQRVRLNASGATYEGEVALSFPAPAPLGVGNDIQTQSGIRCINSQRGIECTRGGHGFVIGDSAVVVLRGASERRYEPAPRSADPEPEPEPRPAEPAPAGSSASGVGQVCWPDTVIPETYIPATHIPATNIGGYHYPAVDFPAQTLPGTTLPGGCFEGPSYLAPANTTVLISGYEELDPDFSAKLSGVLWDNSPSMPNLVSPGYTAASIPDTSAPGYGELNEAGFPKNQYVRSYARADGTQVSGYWRNSPSDGLPTCKIISC